MDTNQIKDLDFGEALGYYLFEQNEVRDPRDVGQAEIVRIPADVCAVGLTPATNEIRYTTSDLGSEWRSCPIPESPEEFMFDLFKVMLTATEPEDGPA